MVLLILTMVGDLFGALWHRKGLMAFFLNQIVGYFFGWERLSS